MLRGGLRRGGIVVRVHIEEPGPEGELVPDLDVEVPHAGLPGGAADVQGVADPAGGGLVELRIAGGMEGRVAERTAQLEAANRELQEEIGYKAGRLDYLGELRPFSKYLAVRSFVYLARAPSGGHRTRAGMGCGRRTTHRPAHA